MIKGAMAACIAVTQYIGCSGVWPCDYQSALEQDSDTMQALEAVEIWLKKSHPMWEKKELVQDGSGHWGRCRDNKLYPLCVQTPPHPLTSSISPTPPPPLAGW